MSLSLLLSLRSPPKPKALVPAEAFRPIDNIHIANALHTPASDPPPLPEKMTPLIKNLVYNLCTDIDVEFTEIRERDPTFRRDGLLRVFAQIIKNHGDTFQNTHAVLYPYNCESAHPDNAYLCFPFPEDSPIAYLQVNEYTPISEDTNTKPTYMDDLTAIANVANLMYYICIEQTDIIRDLTKEHACNVHSIWQTREEHMLLHIIRSMAIALIEFKESQANLVETDDSKQRSSILGVYNRFWGVVQGCASNLETHRYFDNQAMEEWREKTGESCDANVINVLAVERRSKPKPEEPCVDLNQELVVSKAVSLTTRIMDLLEYIVAWCLGP